MMSREVVQSYHHVEGMLGEEGLQQQEAGCLQKLKQSVWLHPTKKLA